VDRLLLMNCFARAVETGSFSAVARELRTSQPSVSRYIAVLEEHLGTRLMHRSTRKLTLTPEGERYYGEVRRILDAVEDAEAGARGEGRPTGLLRVSCTTALGGHHVLPRLPALLEKYPELEIDFQLGDRYADLIEEGLDLVIRVGPLKDSTLRTRQIGAAQRICVASPAYLARHGTPKRPADLANHNCVIYSLSATGPSWSFRDGEVTVNGRLRVNTPDGIYSAVLNDVGIGYGPLWMFEDAVAKGQVVLVLRDLVIPPLPINILYSEKRLLARRAIVFMDFIEEAFRAIPALQAGALERLGGRSDDPSVRDLRRFV
jgi:LysR family transcriptional regulator, regulator for bpeEF and oprC